MRRLVPWGRLIVQALDAGLQAEDALWAVLSVGTQLQRGELDHHLNAELRTDPRHSGMLTEREREVLRTLDGNGVNFAAAAESLDCTLQTVRGHMKNVRAKLAVRSTVAAITMATAQGFLDERQAA